MSIDLPEKREKVQTTEEEEGGNEALRGGGGGEESRVAVANRFETFLKNEKQNER